MVSVSVVVPLYGGHTGRDALARTSAAWLAQDLPCEVLVGYVGDDDAAGRPTPVDDRVRVIRADPGLRAPGLLRNLAAAHARSPLLYLSDADVAPVGADFLARAVALAGACPLGQPWMYRLLGGPDTVAMLQPRSRPAAAAGTFCFANVADDGVLHPVPGEHLEWKDRVRHGESVLAPVVAVPAGVERDADDRRETRAPYHWGGLLVERDVFAGVGGYCPRYRGWGCEDDDLLVKLAACGPVARGWQVDPSWACAHVEHGYFHAGSPDHEANRAVFRARRAEGPEAMIAADRAEWSW